MKTISTIFRLLNPLCRIMVGASFMLAFTHLNAQLPDVAFIASSPPTVNAAQQLNVSLTIQNNSTAVFPSTEAMIYLTNQNDDNNLDYLDSDVFYFFQDIGWCSVFPQVLPSLAPGQTTTISYSIDLCEFANAFVDFLIPNGFDKVGIVIDWQQAVNEIDDSFDNNSALFATSPISFNVNACPCPITNQCIPGSVFCPSVFDPVCGCDGIEYGNDCEAGLAGVYQYTFGPCGAFDCNSAIDLYCGSSAIYSTIGQLNNVTSTQYSSCPGWNSSNNFDAGDVVFRFERYYFEEINYITMQPTDFYINEDLDLFLFDDCFTNLTSCLDNSLNGFAAYPYPNQPAVEVIEVTNLPAGTYYIVVDGYNSSQEGQFEIALSCEGIYCESATPLECDEPLSGNNSNSYNASSGYSDACIPTLSNGASVQGMFTAGEDLYSFTAPYSGTFTIELTANPSDTDLELFIIDECCPTTLTPTDNGPLFIQEVFCQENCILNQTSPNGIESQTLNLNANQEIFIIVDGFLWASGNYTIEVVCEDIPDCNEIDNQLNCAAFNAASYDPSNCGSNDLPIACYEWQIVSLVGYVYEADCSINADSYAWYVNGSLFSTSSAITLDFLQSTEKIELVVANDCGTSSYVEGSCQQWINGWSNPIFNPNNVVCQPSQCSSGSYSYTIDFGNLNAGQPLVEPTIDICNSGASYSGSSGNYCFNFPEPGCYLVCFDWTCTIDDIGNFDPDACPTRFCKSICIDDQPNCGDWVQTVECDEIWTGGSLTNFDENNFTKSNTYQSECGHNQSNEYLGPDEVIRIDLGNIPRDATICLSGLSADLDIFLFATCNPDGSLTDCIGGVSGAQGFGNASEQIEVFNGSGIYYLVVEQGAAGAFSNYTIEVKCNDFCEDIVSNNTLSQENYVVFDNPQNFDIQYFEVAYPLDSFYTSQIYEFEETIEYDGSSLDYYCPQPGCYYICFWYFDNDGQLTSCCVKYCAEFPDYYCPNYPYINNYVDNPDNTWSCYFTCGPPIDDSPATIIDDNSYIEILDTDGNVVQSNILEGDDVTLPYGEYTVCCYIYDPLCDYWEICCKTYCFPYIPEDDVCDESFIGLTGSSPNYTFSPANDNFTIDITPNTGYDIVCTNDIPSSSCSVTFTDPGVYRVCYYDLDSDLICCEYICIDESDPPTEECFDITYISETEIELSCNLSSTVYGWRITALCVCPPGVNCICDFWNLSGNPVRWDIPYAGEFEICKDFNGCCGEIATCCETICYNPFDPYDGDSNSFIPCDNIGVNGWTFGTNGEVFGDFVYSGDGVGVAGSAWEVYFADTGGGFSRDKAGSNGMNFITDEEGPNQYEFDPDETYFVCFTYLDEDGCLQYCCIKVEVPEFGSCDLNVLPSYIGENDELAFQFNYDGLDENEEVVQWFVGGDDSYDLGIGSALTYTFPEEGTYNIYTLVFNSQTQCYRLCCFQFCCINPNSCNVVILDSYDPLTGSYDLGIGNNNVAQVLEWQIDLPLAYAGTIITDPDNFIPADYGIPPQTKIWVSVKFIDTDGCLRVCCIMLCSTGGGSSCDEECYDDCCPFTDKSWLEELKAQAQDNCNIQVCFDNFIYQATWGNQCVYVLMPCGDATGEVYNCSGDLLFNFGGQFDLNADLFGQIENFVAVWSCSGLELPPCGAFDCDSPNPISCETFELYNPNTDVADYTNWSSMGNSLQIQEESNGNSYLAIERLNNQDADASYDLQSLIGNSSGLLRLRYDAWVPAGGGIVTTLNNFTITLNLQPADSGLPGINVIAGNFFTEDANMNPYVEWDYQYDTWVPVELVLNTLNTDLEISVNDRRVAYVPNTGIISFEDIYFDTQLVGPEKGRIDNICIDSCEDSTPCYDACCDGEDTSWLDDIIETAILVNMECDNNTSTTRIYQCQNQTTCYFMVEHIPCFDGTTPNVTYDRYNCDGFFNIFLPSTLSNCSLVWDYHNGYNPPCDSDGPCPFAGSEDCEDFESYSPDTEVTDYSGWEELITAQHVPTIGTESNGNQYLDPALVVADETYAAQYSLQQINVSTQRLTFRLRFSDYTQHEVFIGNANGVSLNFLPLNNQPRIFIGLGNQNYDYQRYNLRFDVWQEYELVWDSDSDEVWFYIDNQLIRYVANAQFSGFGDFAFYARRQNQANNAQVCLDDICLSSCAPCPPDTEPDLECDIISITNIENQVDGAPAVTFEANASNVDKWEIIDQESGQTIEIPTSSAIYTNGNLEAGVTYLICVYYTDFEGCERICCLKITVPSECNQHVFSSTVSEFEYEISNQGVGGNSLLQSTWIEGNNIGNDLISNYDFGDYGSYYICCLYFDPTSECYMLCCSNLCIEQPQSCEDDLGVEYLGDMDSPLHYGLTLSASLGNDWTWYVDGDYIQNSELNMVDLEFQTLGYNLGDKVEVCVKYFSFSTGCYVTCCTSIQLDDPYQGCDLIETSGDFENGLVFFSSDYEDALFYIEGIGFAGAGSLTFDPNDPNIQSAANADGYIYVCMLYFNGDCYDTCCIPVCINQSNASCSLLDIIYTESNGDFLFVLNENGMQRVNCQVTTPNGATIDLQDQVTFTGSEAGDYTFICEYLDGCGGNLICNTNICATPQIDCEPITFDIDPSTNTVTFIHNISGGTNYNWNFGDGNTSNNPSQTIVHQYPDDGVYVVVFEVSDACGIACVQSVVIDQSQLVATAMSINPSCHNSNDGSITLTINGGETPYNILWSTSDSNVTTLDNLSIGDYSVTIQDQDGQEVILDIDLTAPELIEFDVIVQHTSCGLNNGTIEVIQTNSVGFNTVFLNGVSMGGDNFEGELAPNTYSLLIEDENGCSVSQDVPINTSSEASLSLGDDISICVDEATDIAISSDDTFVDFTWTFDGTVVLFFEQSLTTDQPGTYGVEAMTADGCVATDEVIVSIYEAPQISQNIVHTTCDEANGSIMLSSDNAILITSFDIPSLGLTSSDNSIENLPGDIYDVIVTDSNACTHEISIEVEESSNLMVDLGPDVILCANQTIMLSNMSGDDIIEYTWFVNGLEVSSEVELSIDSGAEVELQASNGTCVRSDIIQVVETTSFDNVAVSPTATSCGINNGQILIEGGENIATYEWVELDTLTTEGMISNLSSDTYTILLTDSFGCEFEVLTFVEASEVEVIDVGGDITLCPNETFSLSEITPEELTNTIWSLDGIDLSEDDIDAINQSGVYTLTGITENECVVMDEISITVLDQLLTQDVNNIELDEGTQYALLIENAITTTWTSETLNLSCNDCLETTFIAQNSGVLEGIALDVNGCSYQFIYTITVNPAGDSGPLSGPNMFTPNNDDSNDFLVFTGIENYPDNELVIVNRWGKTVYETTNYSNDWEGVFNGRPLPDGVYYYFLKYKNEDIEYTLSRDLLLIRER